jgi:hypothetical protein
VVTALWSALATRVYPINPLASSRYRARHVVSGAKSDQGDAKRLADTVGTDRRNYRPIAGDSELVEGVGFLARAHQNAILGRHRQLDTFEPDLRRQHRGGIEVRFQ